MSNIQNPIFFENEFSISTIHNGVNHKLSERISFKEILDESFDIQYLLNAYEDYYDEKHSLSSLPQSELDQLTLYVEPNNYCTMITIKPIEIDLFKNHFNEDLLFNEQYWDDIPATDSKIQKIFVLMSLYVSEEYDLPQLNEMEEFQVTFDSFMANVDNVFSELDSYGSKLRFTGIEDGTINSLVNLRTDWAIEYIDNLDSSMSESAKKLILKPLIKLLEATGKTELDFVNKAYDLELLTVKALTHENEEKIFGFIQKG